MTAETRLMTMLQAHAPLVALVQAHIDPDRADAETPTPFVVFARADTGQQHTLCDAIDNPDVLFDVRVWAATRVQAGTVADAVTAAVRAGGGAVTGQEAAYSDEVELNAAVLKVVVD